MTSDLPDLPSRQGDLRARRRRAALSLTAVIALGTGSVVATRPAPVRWERIDLGGLSEIRADHGVLRAVLVARRQLVTVGGASFSGEIFNGSYGGPVLRAHPGDLARITLVNRLEEPTNLHFHGLRISPLAHGDNMHVSVPPGGAYTYEFRIPRDHPPGLFWYHDHTHGLADAHVTAGLAGTLLIDGFASEAPGLESVSQELLVLKDYAAPGCAGDLMKTQLHCRLISINGAASFHSRMRPGETHLWRISNQGADLTIHLALPGFTLKIVGRDGLPTTRPEEAATLDIMPASRLDVLVTAGARAGRTELVATHVPTGPSSALHLERSLGTVSVAGPPVQAATDTATPPQRDLRGFVVGARRRIVFTEDSGTGQYFIDGRRFSADRVDLSVPLGHVEEWTIENRTQDFHEFHIHQLSFQVVGINGRSQDFTGLVDDVRVPEMGEVRLLLPFLDPRMLGTFMYHCHVLRHEDGGMMAMIEVYDPRVGPGHHICRAPQ